MTKKDLKEYGEIFLLCLGTSILVALVLIAIFGF